MCFFKNLCGDRVDPASSDNVLYGTIIVTEP